MGGVAAGAVVDALPWNGPAAYPVGNVWSAAAGNWRLRVTDYGPGDTGVLDSWALTL